MRELANKVKKQQQQQRKGERKREERRWSERGRNEMKHEHLRMHRFLSSASR